MMSVRAIDPLSGAPAGRLGDPPGHGPRPVWLLAILAIAVLAIVLALRPAPPGDAIKSELGKAASEMSGEVWPVPTPAVLTAMRRDFHGRDVSVEAIRSKQIAVTLRGLDRQTCLGAATKARRIDGPAVVTLEGYGSPEECRDRNDMTWRIMP